MEMLIDTGFFVAIFNTRDQYHTRTKEILKEIGKSENRRMISDYILSEIITKVWHDSRNKELIKQIYKKLNETNFVTIEKITTEDLKQTWKEWIKYSEYPKRPLSYIDCTILALIKRLKIKTLITFDKEFNGLVKNIIN